MDEYETLTGKELDEIELAIVKDKFEAMYVTKDILKLYSDFLDTIGENTVNFDSRQVGYEDAYPLLYLKYLLIGTGGTKKLKHLIIDEMQDYSYMQYCIINWIFKCPMTILGDREQTVDTEKSGVLQFLPKILGKDAKTIVLKKSYRSTIEIATLAADIAGITDTEFFERHGNQPEYNIYSEEEAMINALSNKVEDELSTEGMETIAVLCKTEREALYFGDKLKEILGEDAVTILTKYTDRFKTGIVVAPFYLAKGLEFDGVHVVNVDKKHYYSDYHRQIMYICATRALHELTLYGVGEKSELIPER